MKIKQALQRLKNEVIQMDVRVGVVEQNLLQGRGALEMGMSMIIKRENLLQAKLKDKTNMQRDMNKPIGNGNDYDY